LSTLLYLQSLALFGLFSLNSLPHFVRKIGNEVHLSLVVSTEVATILIAACLFMVARGVGQRRSRAWLSATTLQVILILTSVFHSARFLYHPNSKSSISFIQFGFSHLLSEFVVLGLLIYFRRDFKTVTDPLTRNQTLFFFFRNLFLGFVLGSIIVFFDSHSFKQPPNILNAFEIAIKGLIGISGSLEFVSISAPERLEFFLGGIGLLVAISTLAKFLRPASRNTVLTQENELKVRNLLERYSASDSLSYFALRENKNVVWSKNQKSAIPYSVVNGVMITTGDPLGDQESWQSAMKEFLDEAQRHAWLPAIYGCSEEAGEIWVRESNFDALEIGDEEVVYVATFTLDGPEMKNGRQTINRINRFEYTTTTQKIKNIDVETREKLSSLAQHWRGNASERGFSMALGRFCDIRDPECVITWSESNGEILALLQFVPWNENGLSLDLMRRSPSAETGVNELMICATLEYAKKNQIEPISLNFASFRSVFERGKKLGAGPITRLNHRVLVFLSRFFQMESLYRFNAKFRPVWEPRFVIFPGVSNLLRVGLAILRIESFISTPKFRVKNKIS
jgi:lysyl-tRNA synthetase class 2